MGRPLCDVIGRPGDDDPSFYFKHIPTCVIRPPPKNDRCRVLRPRTTFLYLIYLKIGTKKSKYKKGKIGFAPPGSP